MIRRNEMHIHVNNQSRMQNGCHQQTSCVDLHNGQLTRLHHKASMQLQQPRLFLQLVQEEMWFLCTSTSKYVKGNKSIASGYIPDLDDDEVHTFEPLAMLPPDVLAPARQVPVAQNQPLPPQSYAGQQVPQGNALHGNGSFSGATKAGQEEEGEPAKAAEIRISDELSKGHQGSSPASEMHNNDNREAYKSLPEEPNVLQQQPFQAVHSGLPQSIPVSQPLKSYPTGRMAELLLALRRI